MCGILGGTKDIWQYHRALDSMNHRGPDGKRIVEMQGFTMGFVRLSIVDLSDRAMQPMIDRVNQVALTFNGEIYGFENLRNELKDKGYTFRSSSDSEVLLKAYIEWNEKFVEHIDGMYAVAILDQKENKLKLFRDLAGIKPLYYYYDGHEFAYASELKGIQNLLNDERLDIDNTSIYDYLNMLCIPDPKTIYKNVFKLEQAHKLIFDLESKTIEKNTPFWILKPNELEGNEDIDKEKSEYIRSIIKSSIKEQLVADVPVGGFLSGGIDSSIITVEAQKMLNEYKSFSIGFYDYRSNELPYVFSLQEKYALQNYKYYVKSDEYEQLYYQIIKWYDEPYADTSAYPSFIVSREAKKKCKVILAGDGGDELFAGYPRYVMLQDMEKKEKHIIRDFDRISRLYYNPLLNDEKIRRWLHVDKDYDKYWFFKKHYNDQLPPVTRLQYMDFYLYLPCDILTKIDRVSMANSLEVRVPFLCKKMIEYLFSLTQTERCGKKGMKAALKTAYEEDIPNNLLYRRKAGFGIPESFFGRNVSQPLKLIQDVFNDYCPLKDVDFESFYI